MFKEQTISILYKFFQRREKKGSRPSYETRLTLILKPDMDN